MVFYPTAYCATITYAYVSLSDKPRVELPSLEEIRGRCMQQLEKLRPDHIRRLNPTPYKVCLRFNLSFPFCFLQFPFFFFTKSLLRAGECECKAVWVYPFPMVEWGPSRRVTIDFYWSWEKQRSVFFEA